MTTGNRESPKYNHLTPLNITITMGAVIKAKVTLKALLLVALITSLFSAFPQSTKAADLSWSRANTPSDGVAGKWVLAAGSDVRFLTCATDGTLYGYADPTGTPFRIFKSTDGGVSWSYTGRVEDTIIDIAVVPDNPSSVYYATTSRVYKFNPAGDRFDPIAINPGGAGTNGIEITSLDVSSADGTECAVIGTRDTAGSEFGGVYTWDGNESLVWQDSGIGNYDAYTVAYSPNFAIDRQIVALASDECDTVVMSNLNNGGWGAEIGNSSITGLLPVSAAIAFPSDYSSDLSLGRYVQYIALNTGSGQGDVFRLEGQASPAASTITDLNAGSRYGTASLDITSIAVSGNASEASLMAGSSDTTHVYVSTNGGQLWSRASQPPSGNSGTYVVMAPDFATSGVAYDEW
jgi:hypothetical protein